ncbi:uncharacterized protein NPIL_54621 [Nephila pilipes]|uniref:Uncharacterized protein n=1 Tax=Nephila pilipes TaxID=299642 RepID=A0A8X6QWC9_NEPPI|nr:uncharacterized protein NPIL_54621 [Nephila pilipes]
MDCNEDEDENENDDNAEINKPSYDEMINSFETIRRGLQCEENTPEGIFGALQRCEVYYETNPKVIGSGLTVTKIATFISVCEYNDGRKSQSDLMLALGIKIHRKYINKCVSVDKVRVSTAKKRATEASFEASKAKKIKKS